MIKAGLKPTPKDERDFRLGAITLPIDLNQLEGVSFEVGRSAILDQKDLDFCTGFATCAASSIQEGVSLNPHWSFAVSKYLSGNIDDWGQDLRTALKVHTKYGAVENAKTAINALTPDNELRNIKNYPDSYFGLALEHKKQSFFKVEPDGYPDLFDALRANLFKHREKQCAIITGITWRPEWTLAYQGKVLNAYNSDGFGHAFILTGQKYIDGEPYLVAQLSNGTTIGNQGYFYISREVCNKELTYGNYMFLDMPPVIAGHLNERGIKIDTFWGKIYKGIISFFWEIFR